VHLAILTGGGDAPGLNAVIRAVVYRAVSGGHRVTGFLRGWKGVLEDQGRDLGIEDVRDIHKQGGTILLSSRTNPFKVENGMQRIADTLSRNSIDCLIAVGGEDTLGVARKLSESGFKVLGVPKTIDNDLAATDYTFGFDTAINIVMESLDRLETTARSHERVVVVEIMGRHAGWMALHGGMAGGASVILLPEEPFDTDEVCRILRSRWDEGRHWALVAVAEGAMALFGEKYGDVVRTITIGDPDHRHSYELCGGTHLDRTSDVGAFLIVSEGSAAAGVRRIEAVTGRGAYELVARRFKMLKQAAAALKSAVEEVPQKAELVQDELAAARKQAAALRIELALSTFHVQLSKVQTVGGINLLVMELPGADKETLSQLADRFREKYPANGICVIATVSGEQVIVMAAVTQDLIKKGLKAGDLVGHVSRQLGAGGGGAPHLAFGGGRDAAKLSEALANVPGWVEGKMN